MNMLGGYAAGVDGVEIGTVFNIVKNDMQHVQVSGLVNIVGGKTKGVQLAGLHNNVLDSMKGLQVAGVSNITEGNMEGVQLTGAIGQVRKNMEGVSVSGIGGINRGHTQGWQVAGAFTYNGKNLDGLQLSGIGNYNREDAHGAQIAGVGNINRGVMKGVQLASIFNYAKQMDGVQIGLVNIADTVNGYSIGIISIVRRGYKKAVLFSTDVLPFNIAWKSGRSELYSILLGGADFEKNSRAWSLGYGVGKIIPINKRLSLAAEITGQNLFLGAWENDAQIFRIQPSLNIKLSKRISFFAGPALAIYTADKVVPMPGYKSTDFGAHYPSFSIGNSVTGWLGWQAGISLF